MGTNVGTNIAGNTDCPNKAHGSALRGAPVMCYGVRFSVLHAYLHHLVADVDEVYLVGVNGELCLASTALLLGYLGAIGGVEGNFCALGIIQAILVLPHSCVC